jgi:GAF domain-containing protein
VSWAHGEIVRGVVVTGGRVVCVVLAAGAALVVSGDHGRTGASWVWLGATVLVAATVIATRAPLERLADRVAYGPDGDPYALLSRFVARISETLAVDDVLPHVARTVTEAVHSPRGEVRLWLADGQQSRQSWPLNAPAPAVDIDIPLEHHGRPVGELGLAVAEGDLSDDDRELLARLAGTAGLALANVRLTYDLRHELAESTELARRLDRSRQRLLEAAAQQTERFVATVDQQVQSRLRRAELALDSAADGDPDGLADAHREATAALAALREIAAGVFPPALADRGLVHAVQMYCLRFDGRVKIRSLPTSVRGPLSIEAAGYFCVVQLVDDCVNAGPIALTLEQDEAALRMAIQTSQAPGADTVQLVTDRVEATEGQLVSIGSAQGWITTIRWSHVEAEATPCPSD